MLVVVEVCDVNKAAGLDLEQLEDKYAGVSVIRNPCLSQCSQCATMPFAYVNGEFLSAVDTETLWHDLEAAVQKELHEWETEV